MAIVTVGFDIAKNVFAVHGVNATGRGYDVVSEGSQCPQIRGLIGVNYLGRSAKAIVANQRGMRSSP